MKCPKCEYLAFESGDRCKNCGYEFSLSASGPQGLDFTLDQDIGPPKAPLDLDRLIGASEPAGVVDLPLFQPLSPGPPDTAPSAPPGRRGGVGRPDGPGARAASADAPLIAASARPRAPLGVRRATPEVPRARLPLSKPAPPEDTLFDTPPIAAMRPAIDRRGARPAAGETLATPSSRIMAALVDASLLSALDAVVLYFTLRLCGLPAAEIASLPMLPLAAFFLLLNGGYFVAFTTVGGQSIGKMALGIRVITQEDGAVPVGRATVRTLAYLVSALPLGAGFLPGVMSPDRLALHDRLAHTRVVRPSST